MNNYRSWNEYLKIALRNIYGGYVAKNNFLLVETDIL